MDVKQCENGHYFDRAKYETCPVCGAKEVAGGEKPAQSSSSHSMGSVGTAPVKEQPKGKSSLFGRLKKQKGNPEMISVPQESGDETVGIYDMGDKAKEIMEEPSGAFEDSNTPILEGLDDIIGQEQPQRTTMSEFNLPPQQEPVQQPVSAGTFQATPEPQQVSAGSYQATPTSVSGGTYQAPSTSVSGGYVQQQPQQQAPSLAEQIRNVSPVQEKTFGYFSAAPKNVLNEAAPTPVAAPAPVPQVNTEPVVGWLVAIKGPHFGQSFCIAAGRNSIGRSPDNKICVSNDKQISREKHAWITYEPKKRAFYIQPGESSGLTYLNDENVMETRDISPADIIELGGSRFRFVPFCSEDFTWEDVMED